MSQSQPSSSSKVTVEYHDPFNVYQLISPGLLPRLPLRNLHWESHAGPLRSIHSLHVDLVPSLEDQARPQSSASNSEISRVKSSESTASGDDGFRVQNLGKVKEDLDKEVARPDSRAGTTIASRPKERRHQIPGLRQTPYLKVFFLRCDDNETYKTQRRKQVREWIKEHTSPGQEKGKNAQENHDAFEWLIVHVIVPNTAAATQPRFSAKGGNTLLEKLRADFNTTGKNAQDRIAQVRIGINDVPYELLPRVVPAIPGSYTETPKENEEAWADLMGKLKELILSSFDNRVGQYEEDIREKDAQRSLPGWNFCTFFVLKEGLARGFESVGLVEDALVGYDELSVGLDAIVREQALQGGGAEHGGSFLPFTEDLRKQVERGKAAILKENGLESDEADGPIDLQSTDSGDAQDTDEIPLSATKKPYRDLILANNISIFDFRCYLFSRQLSLLLRMGNAWSSREELLAKLKELRESSLQGVAARLPPEQPSEEAENLVMLAQICKRTLDFLASISRIMRQDLLASEAYHAEKNSDGTDAETTYDPIAMQVIQNVVSSFTFCVAEQILAQTSTAALPIPPSTLAPPMSKSQEQKAAIPEPKTMMHPVRSSSLIISGPQATSPGVFPGGREGSLSSAANSASTFLKAGLEELAAHRAELYLVSRSVLERLGTGMGWPVGWNVLDEIHKPVSAAEMEDVDLSSDVVKEKAPPKQGQMTTPTSHGLTSQLLSVGLSSPQNFHRLYETLTDKALRHFTVSNSPQSMQSCMADLAMLKYHLEDYGAAASYFYRMTPFYGEGGWSEVEVTMLVLYTKCLKKLDRKDEYVKVAVKLLGKGAAAEKERFNLQGSLRHRNKHGISFGGQETVSVDGYLADLLTVIPAVQNEVTIPLQMFIGSVEVDGNIRYQEGRDSFALILKMRWLLGDEMDVERVRVRIAPVSGGQGRDIWLESEESLTLKKGMVKALVMSNVIIPGTYIVKQITLHAASKLLLSYEAEPPNPTHSLHGTGQKFFKCPRLLLYQRPNAFDLKMFASRSMQLDRNRTIELELSSGWNAVQSGELHVRAATAGLRLQTSEVKVIDGELDVLKNSDAGVIRFGEMASGTVAKIRLPYNLEHDVTDIAVKLEISYTTSEGTFFFANNPSVSIMLPLGVNVQDVFKHQTLFSKFTISSASSSPLRLLKSSLGDSDTFEARNGGDLRQPVAIFPKQPASLLYKITPRTVTKPVDETGRSRKVKASLSLIIHYICLEEEIDKAVELSLQQAFANSDLHEYSRLVLPTIISQLRSLLSPHDLERTALISELSTSVLANIKWRDYFGGLGKSALTGSEEEVATALELWIEEWRNKNPVVFLAPIEICEDTIDKSRSIIIPVEVPSVTVVHTADIVLHGNSASSDAIVAMNQPIPASLRIKWTRIWDTLPQETTRPLSQSTKDVVEKNKELNFVYEISALPDSWLLGGKRKGHFTLPSDKSKVQGKLPDFPILLIPLREGYLPFPHLDIKLSPVTKPFGTDAKGANGIEEAKTATETCETDYKNFGETVRVVSNAKKTTVSLDANGPQGGAWLLESERRDEGAFVV